MVKNRPFFVGESMGIETKLTCPEIDVQGQEYKEGIRKEHEAGIVNMFSRMHPEIRLGEVKMHLIHSGYPDVATRRLLLRDIIHARTRV